MPILLLFAGLGGLLFFGSRLRNRDVSSRGPADPGAFLKTASEAFAKTQPFQGHSGTTYRTALVSVTGDVQLFDVYAQVPQGFMWTLRYSHNRVSKARKLMGSLQDGASKSLVATARRDFGV